MSREYTGQVTPGGAAQVRPLPGLTVRKASVGEMDNNTYLLTCTETGEQALVDAAAQPRRLAQLITEGGSGLAAVITTHRHRDHTGALAEVVSATGARTYAGEADADHLPAPTQVRLRHGDTVEFGALTLGVVALRGHTPGGIALAYDDGERVHLFTGDSLFPGGVGATKNEPDQSFEQLIDDVEGRIFEEYDDDTWVYPGHGGDTTLGAERPHLAQWRERGW